MSPAEFTDQDAERAALAIDLQAGVIILGMHSRFDIEQAAVRVLAGVVFTRGYRLVRVQVQVVPVSPTWLRLALMQRIQFFKYDGRSKKFGPADCPKNVARYPIQSASVGMSGFPPLPSEFHHENLK